MKRQRIFISYKRDVEPDQSLARQIFEALAPDHDVFIDSKIPPARLWAVEIEKALDECDLFIVLLSEASVKSQMVVAEITTIGERRKTAEGAQASSRPLLVPVRLAYDERLPYDLRAYIDPTTWISWTRAEDTNALLGQLRCLALGQILAHHLDDQNLVAIHPFIKRLSDISSTSTLPEDYLRVILQMLNHMSRDVSQGSRSAQDLAEFRLALKYARQAAPSWTAKRFSEFEPLFRKLFGSYVPGPETVPIVLLAMTAEQAAELASGAAYADSPDGDQYLAFLRQTLEENGLGESWQSHYGAHPELWCPFTAEDDSETFRSIVESAFQNIGQKASKVVVPRFIGAQSLAADRDQLLRLREEGCLVVVDTISLHHPEIQHAYHASYLDVFPTTAVARVAPTEAVLQLEVLLARLIARQVDHEFHQRRLALDDSCRLPRDRIDLATFLWVAGGRLVGSDDRSEWYRGTEGKLP